MNNEDIAKEALSASRCLISVIGDHAGEDMPTIFKRKIEDIQKVNHTFWLIKSPKAKPAAVQDFCKSGPVYVLFIAPATTGGARPTEVNEKAATYSLDGLKWQALPVGLGPVSGKLDSRAYALVFDMLTIVDNATVDLWAYSDFDNTEKPIKMILGCSTVCATKKDMTNHSDKMKSRFRKIIAVAHLTKPYCVFVK